jgi:hypothetical protein
LFARKHAGANKLISKKIYLPVVQDVNIRFSGTVAGFQACDRPLLKSPTNLPANKVFLKKNYFLSSIKH